MHLVYILEGQVPEMVMIGQTTYIINLCEYEWFQWVIYYQPKEGYPNDKMDMGQYLGPFIDVGNVITYKIFFPYGNYVCRSTVHPWTPVEESNHVFLADCENICPKYRRR